MPRSCTSTFITAGIPSRGPSASGRRPRPSAHASPSPRPCPTTPPGAELPRASTPGGALGLRFLTGAALAGVYPPGMKLVAGWYRDGRGLAIGILVGALTLGSAGPHLVRWLVPADAWRTVLLIAAGAGRGGGLLVLLVPGGGPDAAPSPPFRWSAAPSAFPDPAAALAHGG